MIGSRKIRYCGPCTPLGPCDLDAFDRFLNGTPALLLFLTSPYLFSSVFCHLQDILEYKKKQRPQKIKMLDGAIKTIMVDDSKTVGELLVTICSRIGMSILL